MNGITVWKGERDYTVVAGTEAFVIDINLTDPLALGTVNPENVSRLSIAEVDMDWMVKNCTKIDIKSLPVNIVTAIRAKVA